MHCYRGEEHDYSPVMPNTDDSVLPGLIDKYQLAQSISLATRAETKKGGMDCVDLVTSVFQKFFIK
jgi:hypothetical protein